MFRSVRSASRGPRRRNGRAALGAVAAVALASTAIAITSSPTLAAPGDTVQILSFNDYHGHVKGDQSGSIGDEDAGGGEYLAAKLAELRAASSADASFTVAAGDLIGGSPFFSGLFRDEPSVESLNAMGLDISGVGNHEFDDGVDELLRMQNGGCHPVDGCYFPMDPYAGADFQWLAANVIDDATSEPIDLDDGKGDTEDLGGYSLVEVDGTEIAFIGMTLEGTDSLVAASGVADVTFADEVDTANALVTEIQADHPGVEAIFVLLHEGGVPTPFAINGCQGISGPIVAINAGLDTEIDGIISGHTHQPYTCSLPGGADGNRAVVSAWEYGKVVTELNFTLDAQGDVVRNTVAMMNHEVLQGALTPDPAVTSVIDKWQPLADVKGNDPVGTVTETITRGGDPTGSDRGVESAAGNLVADAQLAAAQTADPDVDVAFMNPGGVRSDLEFPASGSEGDGVVTYGEAFTFQPFNNTMHILEMTGAQIVSVLEEQCQPGDSSRPVLHLGVSDGFTYTLDITTQNGVCLDVEVTDVQLGGVDIVPTDTYKVAVNNFLADGGDDFDTFADVTNGPPLMSDLEALIDYLAANSPVAPPSTDRVDEIGNNLPGTIQSLAPARLLETRDEPGYETVDGEFEGEGRLGAGETLELVVAGRGGVPANASAASLNVGAVLPSDLGFLTIYPCGEDLPIASNVNYLGGDVVSNSVVVQIGEDGKVCIYTLTETDLIVDVNGLVPVDGTPESVVPARLLETRDVPGFTTTDGEFEAIGERAAGTTLELVVAGRGGVDADAEAVIINVGAVTPIDDGFLTIYPCGEDLPQASSLNYYGGDAAVSNLVMTQIGDDGKVCIYTLANTHLIADVTAFVPVGGSPDPLVPARLLETRDEPGYETIDNEFEGEGRIAADSVLELVVAGRGGVPADAGTVVLNVAAVLPAEFGFLTVYPCGEDTPQASNVNHIPNDVVSNFVLAKVGDDGKVCIYTLAETDMVVDVVAASPAVVPYRE